MERMGDWAPLDGHGPRSLVHAGVELRKGSRVRLHPAAGGDIFDLALEGRVAVVEGIDRDAENRIHLAVTLDQTGCALHDELQ